MPDEVIVMIVKHLSFEEKAMLRLVSKYFKVAVEYVFAEQTSVEITLEQRTPVMTSDVHHRNWACDHKFDSGFSVTFFYPIQNNDSPTERDESGMFHSVNEFTPETGETKGAFFCFFDAISFAAKYFTSVTVVKIVFNSYQLRFYTLARQNKNYTGLTPESVCNELINRYSRQLQCIHCDILDVTESHFFPRLLHLKCQTVSCSVEHLFRSTAPGLVSLKNVRFDLTDDNYQYLPKGLLSLTTTWQNTVQNDIKQALKSAARESIVCLDTICPTVGADEIPDEIFPNLKSLTIRTTVTTRFSEPPN